MDVGMKVVGLPQLRSALRAVGNGLDKALTQALKKAAEGAKQEARSNAPRRSGKLAGSIRTYVPGGIRAAVGSSLVYGPVQEFGGNIRWHNATSSHLIPIRGRHFVESAVDRREDDAARILQSEIVDLAHRAGWAGS